MHQPVTPRRLIDALDLRPHKRLTCQGSYGASSRPKASLVRSRWSS